MRESKSNKDIELDGESISLSELFQVILDGKWVIIMITVFASVSSVIYSLSLPDIYKSQAILAPVEQSSSISGSLQRYSSLAGFAGISIPSADSGNNFSKAMEKISSLSFFEKNLMPNIYLPELMAVKSWDAKLNKLQFDRNIFNETNNSWNINIFDTKEGPSSQKSFKEFQKLLNITKDKESGFVKISVKHQSPYVAKKWIELIVKEINSFYRQKDRLEAQKAVNYVNAQMNKTNFTEIKFMMAEISQQNIQTLTLIEASEFYVFDYIDPPAVMEQKSEPGRALICIIGAFLGAFLSIIIVLLRHLRKQQ